MAQGIDKWVHTLLSQGSLITLLSSQHLSTQPYLDTSISREFPEKGIIRGTGPKNSIQKILNI
jgi:hypothetical protein